MSEVTDNTFDREVLKNLIESSPLSFKQNEGSFIFDCPRCSKKDKLWMRKRDGRFVCFYCAEIDNFKGRPEYALKELLGLPLDEIRRKLYGSVEHKDGLGHIECTIKNPDDKIYEEEGTPLLEEIKWPFDAYGITEQPSARGARYLEGRGVPASIAAEYSIRYWPSQRRVLFPVIVYGQLVGHQARAVYPTEWTDDKGKVKSVPKIITSTGLRRDLTLMFHDRLAGSKHAVLCEGPMDAIKAHLCGGNVATMGKVVSRGQLQALRRMGIEKVYLALDPDAADEAARLTSELGDLDTYIMKPPADFKDLGEMPFEAVREVFDTAKRIRSNRFISFWRPPVIT